MAIADDNDNENEFKRSPHAQDCHKKSIKIEIDTGRDNERRRYHRLDEIGLD
jgi:hypothetical protein